MDDSQVGVGRCGECHSPGARWSSGGADGHRQFDRAGRPGAARAARRITEIDTQDARVARARRRPSSIACSAGGSCGRGDPAQRRAGGWASRPCCSRSRRRAHGPVVGVLYASGEESAAQVRLRAERTGRTARRAVPRGRDRSGDVSSGTSIRSSRGLLIVDSVAGRCRRHSDGAAGQPAQVREVASALIGWRRNAVCPSSSSGTSPKTARSRDRASSSNLVDVVLSLRGRRQTSLRFVRALKNRFRPDRRGGVLRHDRHGDRRGRRPERPLPRSRRAEPGTCVTIAMEGRRALPVEIQALAVRQTAPQSAAHRERRRSSRVAMVLAVLESRMGLTLSTATSTCRPSAACVGRTGRRPGDRDRRGQRRQEPQGVSSSGSRRIRRADLTGEIRNVTQAAQRASEAKRLGYHTRCSTPRRASSRRPSTKLQVRGMPRDDSEPGF